MTQEIALDRTGPIKKRETSVVILQFLLFLLAASIGILAWYFATKPVAPNTKIIWYSIGVIVSCTTAGKLFFIGQENDTKSFMQTYLVLGALNFLAFVCFHITYLSTLVLELAFLIITAAIVFFLWYASKKMVRS